MRRRAQSGMNAAVLVAIIAGLMILYILFLPENEKDDLLGNGNVGGGGGGGSNGKDLTILLTEGSIDLDKSQSIRDKTLPNVYLLEEVSARRIAEFNPFTVRNGWFDQQARTMDFAISNLEQTDNVILSFDVRKGEGTLMIGLNGRSIYDYDPGSSNVRIDIDGQYLDSHNSISFSVSDVGLAFWRTNEYSIENAVVFGDLTDRSRQESRNIFELTETEYRNIKSATLDFIPYCGHVSRVGTLEVLVNNRNAYSAVPVCDDLVRIPVLAALNEGENRIIFKTDKGSYSIEQIKINLEGDEQKKLAYYFQVDDAQRSNLRKGTHHVNVSMKFIDDGDDKRAVIQVNDYKRMIDTDEGKYNYDVTAWIEENTANNYIEIEPKTDLRIVDLRVIYWEK